MYTYKIQVCTHFHSAVPQKTDGFIVRKVHNTTDIYSELNIRTYVQV